jgi:hypothetical protein
MFDLKPLSRDGIPGALAKATRYRLLNEPGETESICLDVLAIDAGNQEALATLILALTDQFADEPSRAVGQIRDVLPRLASEYEREYYGGIVHERLAKAKLRRGGPVAASGIYEEIREALTRYERAGALRPAGNDDAILRWNACVRLLTAHGEIRPAPAEREEPLMLE